MSIRILSPGLQSKAEKELNEVPKRIREDLEHIRNWIAKQPHLNVRTDDQWLLSFLRTCKFSLQRTKEKLDIYYTARSLLPELLGNRDLFLPEIQEFLKRGIVLPLSKIADPSGPRIIFIRNKSDPDTMQLTDCLKTLFMILDILLNEDDNFVIGGQMGALDMDSMTVNHLLQVTPSVCKKVVFYLQNAYPSRPKAVHAINISTMVETVYNLYKPFIKAKIVDRIRLYNENNIGKLSEVIPKSVVPKEYGGDGDSIDELTSQWKKKVESYHSWFLEDAKYCSDESKRPGKPKTTECVVGIEGSFRKLDID